jgi:nucleoside-diphosphate-sugar epimerase
MGRTDVEAAEQTQVDPKAPAMDTRPLVMITGCSGLIGTRLAERLAGNYQVVGLDLHPPATRPPQAFEWIECDLTREDSVRAAFQQVQSRFGQRLASCIHLAAYYDFSGEPSSLYQELTVQGTRRVLRELQSLEVEQFVFSSTLLVMASAESGEVVDESSPVDAEWDYPQSKLTTEKVIANQHGDIPVVVLRIAGVYDEDCHSVPVAQQIARIYEEQFESYFFPGDASHGQSFVHLDDLVDCLLRTIERRGSLDAYEMFLIGEEDVMSYGELQDVIGDLLHGKEWPTIRIPKPMAKAGAWVQDKIAGGEDQESFIKPWMIDLADQNYPVRIDRAQARLEWHPRHTLRSTVPEMIRRLKRDPAAWYAANKLGSGPEKS